MNHVTSTQSDVRRAPACRPADRADAEREEFIDDFELVEIIARSGMGSVYKARHTETHQTVVLKVPHLHLESDVVFFERFAREERIGLRLDHSAIPRTLPVTRKSRQYIVQEYVEGTTLRDRLRRGPIEPNAALQIASGIVEALVYVHGLG